MEKKLDIELCNLDFQIMAKAYFYIKDTHHLNIISVGTDDESIYSLQGEFCSFIFNFTQFSGTWTQYLEKNYANLSADESWNFCKLIFSLKELEILKLKNNISTPIEFINNEYKTINSSHDSSCFKVLKFDDISESTFEALACSPPGNSWCEGGTLYYCLPPDGFVMEMGSC